MMKIGIFADPHYCGADCLCGTRRPRLSLSKVREAYRVFKEETVGLTVCMGDFTDHCESHEEALTCLESMLSVIRESGLPFYNVTGNHDYLDFTGAELENHGLRVPPFSVVSDGIRMIFLDANYRSDMRRFDEAGVEWTDSNLPPEQVAFLSETLRDAEEPCVVFVHESLDPFVESHHIIQNAAEIRKILSDSKKVRLVVQGHYHPGAEHTVDGIPYLTIPAMCEGEENRFRILDIGSCL